MTLVRYCARCGSQVKTGERCTSCGGVLLHSPIPQLTERPGSEVGYDVGDWAGEERGRLIGRLIEAEIPHRFDGHELTVSASDEDFVDELVTELRNATVPVVPSPSEPRRGKTHTNAQKRVRWVVAVGVVIALAAVAATRHHKITDRYDFTSFQDTIAGVISLDPSAPIVQDELDTMADTVCSDIKVGMPVSTIDTTVVQMLYQYGVRIINTDAPRAVEGDAVEFV